MREKTSSITNDRKLIFLLEIHTFLTALVLILILAKPSLSFDVYGLIPLIFFNYSVHFKLLLYSKGFPNIIKIDNRELNIECLKSLVNVSWRIILVTWLLSNGILYKFGWLILDTINRIYVSVIGILL